MYIYAFQIITGNFKNQAINYVSDNLLETGELLKEITPEKQYCLTKFTKCFELVSWLRKTMKGKERYRCKIIIYLTYAAELYDLYPHSVASEVYYWVRG